MTWLSRADRAFLSGGVAVLVAKSKLYSRGIDGWHQWKHFRLILVQGNVFFPKLDFLFTAKKLSYYIQWSFLNMRKGKKPNQFYLIPLPWCKNALSSVHLSSVFTGVIAINFSNTRPILSVDRQQLPSLSQPPETLLNNQRKWLALHNSRG